MTVAVETLDITKQFGNPTTVNQINLRIDSEEIRSSPSHVKKSGPTGRN